MSSRSLAIQNLGINFTMIQDHEPSLPSVPMDLDAIVSCFIKPHSLLDCDWSPIQVSNMKYRDEPCVQILFTRMTPDEIFNLLNNLFIP